MKTIAKPLTDRVLVKPLSVSRDLIEGLYLPDSAKEIPQLGEIVSTGPGRISDISGKLLEMEIKVGDKVTYGKYSGIEVPVDDEKFLLMNEKDVLAVISKGSEV